MESKNDHHGNNEVPVQISAPLFVGQLTKGHLKSLPGHFFLLSNIGDPLNSALEIEVQEETSREAVWRLLVDRRLDGRTFFAFRDRESLEAEKLARWRAALQQFGICGLMRIFAQIQRAGVSAPLAPSNWARSLGIPLSSQMGKTR
jgi:hypothetical protein